MHDICKFFVYTRGRTGSTAIIDEINKHPDITCWQELFIALSKDPMMEGFYKKHGVHFDDYEIGMEWRPSFELWSKQYRKIRLLKMDLYLNNLKPATSATMAQQYLEEIERREIDRSKQAVGFKLIQVQAENTPGLFRVLKKQKYKAIYLERVNIIKRVISGIIAKKRHQYNALKYQPPNDTYTIDLDELQTIVHDEEESVKRQKWMLKKEKFNTLFITYEEFLENREKFYREIFEFLEVECRLPEKTDYSIMIPSVRDVVGNYEELQKHVKKMGYEGMLE